MNEIVNEIKELHRKRVDFHSTEKSCTLRIKAICRRFVGGDKEAAEKLYKGMQKPSSELEEQVFVYCEPVLTARSYLEKQRKFVEKQIENNIKQLPIWNNFVKDVRGVGPLALGIIIGEAGDLSNYANPAKLWKRMGLAVINGERQRKYTDKEKALEHGYSPKRRSIMYVVGDPIIKSGGVYKDIYSDRKEFEKNKAEKIGLRVAPSGKIPEKSKGEYMSVGHIHNRAKRYMEKRLLRDLWNEWNKQAV